MKTPRARRFPTILLAVGLVLLAGLPAAAGENALPRSLASSAGRELTPQPESSPGQLESAITFERISTADGLSFPIVRDILQDRNGYLWFATDSGLNRYDGYEFTVYKHDPADPTSIRFDDVRVVYEDQEATLWVGGGSGLDRFDRATQTFTRVDGRGQVFSIGEDSSGTLWVGFWHGLYGYDRTTGEIVFSSQPDPNISPDWSTRSESSVMAIQEDREGNLWVGTVSGLYCREPTTGDIRRFGHEPEDPASLSSEIITAIHEDSEGDLWIGTVDGGLNRYDGELGTVFRYRHDPDDPDSLGPGEVATILGDSAGVLWVGTANGLDRFDPEQGRFLHYRHDPDDPGSLSDDVILSLYEDFSGVLWVGTANGVNKYNRREDQFVHYKRQGDPPAEPVYTLDVAGLMTAPQPAILSEGKVATLHEDEDGVLWIGTLGGGLHRLDRQSGQMTVYRHDPDDPASLSSNQVNAVTEDRAGILWVGTGDGWLEQLDPETEIFVHHRNLGASVDALAEDRVGNLWIGTGGEGLYRLDSNRQALEHYPEFWRDPDHWRREGSLSSHVVSSLAVDEAGVLWVGTVYGGINLWNEEEDRFTHYRHDPEDPTSLSHEQVLSILDDPTRGVVWIGTGGGLNRFDRATQTFTAYTEEEGLQGDIVGCILIDDAGFLWLGTVKGLSRFDPGTETFRTYDQRDGVGVLSAGQVARGSCLASQAGEMLFGGSDGVYVFDPMQIKESLQPPPIALTALKVSNETVRRDLAEDEQIRLPYDDNFVSFEFAALDYTNPEKNQYAYMLEGLDKDWVYAGTRRFADYPDLKPGEYIFRVKGSNSDGIWNEEGATVGITVEPPFWDTWLFRGAVVLALALGAVGVVRQRVKNVEARSRELEREVEERTHEIERRRRVAEGLRDILAVLNSDRPLNEVLDYIVAQAGQLLGAGATVLHQIEEGRQFVAIQASAGLPGELAGFEAIPFDASWADEAILTRQPYVVADLGEVVDGAGVEGDPLAERWLTVTRQRYHSFLAVPLVVEERVNHCLAFYYAEAQAFSDEELALAVALADQAALAIENARLYEQAQELAAVEERQRLARDLHDAVSQTLFSASLIAEALPELWVIDPEEAYQLLDKLQQLSRGALAEMRGLLMELRPAALAEASMKDLLRQLGQAASGREGIPVTVTVDEACLGRTGALPADVHLALYRIAQESLNNVVKHAQASQVEVSLGWAGEAPPQSPLQAGGRSAMSPDARPSTQSLLQAGGRPEVSSAPEAMEFQLSQPAQVELCIRDDGVGFEPADVSPEHLGLGIMRERAEAVGAWLKVESSPRQGTLVIVVWPGNEGRRTTNDE